MKDWLVEKMGRPKKLTIRKTNGFTVADQRTISTLQIVNMEEDKARRDPRNYVTCGWQPSLVRDITEAKNRGLVAWDKKQTVRGKTCLAGLRLTKKGMKMLGAGVLGTRGRVFLSPPREGLARR